MGTITAESSLLPFTLNGTIVLVRPRGGGRVAGRLRPGTHVASGVTARRAGGGVLRATARARARR